MSSVKPLDLLFLAIETSARPMHMSGYQLFSLPKSYRGDYISDLVAAFRQGPVDPPFNRIVRFLDKRLARWETVEPNLRYHVRHLAVPRPGRIDQLNEIVAMCNMPLLDRAHPLWECYVIEGIHGGRFAIFVKLHHALMDGMGGMRLLAQSLSSSARTRQFNPIWSLKADAPKRSRASETKRQPRLSELVPGIQKTAAAMLSSARQLSEFRPWDLLMPFRASASPLNKELKSGERSFASCEFPLESVRAIRKASGATINDIIMTAIDIGVRRYLDELQQVDSRPLRVLMPMSLRSRSGGGSGGNQASILLAELGPADLKPAERLQYIMGSTAELKAQATKVPTATLHLYTLLLISGVLVNEAVPGMSTMPTNNLLISNMAGPEGKLYLAGAPLLGFYGIPIVPPGCGLNVTFLSCLDKICLSLGANPDAIEDPERLVSYISEGFQSLTRGTVKRTAKSARKTTTPQRRKRA